MTHPTLNLDELERRAKAATPGPWQLQTSNSFRRIGTLRADGDVICAVTQHSDGHPDLHARPETLEYVAACSPDVVVALIARLRAAEAVCEAADSLEQAGDARSDYSRSGIWPALAAWRAAKEQR